MNVLFSGRMSLSKRVAKALQGIDLRPGEVLVITRRNHWSNADEIREREIRTCFERPIMPLNKLDRLLATPIDSLELYHSRRYRALHAAGVHFIGQLARMWLTREFEGKVGFGRGTQALERLKWALDEKGLRFGMHLPCGPREMKRLQKINIHFLLECAFNCSADRRMTGSSRVYHGYIDELAAIGINTFWDMIHHPEREVVKCFKRAVMRRYLRNEKDKKASARFFVTCYEYKNPESLRLVREYLQRYRLRIGQFA